MSLLNTVAQGTNAYFSPSATLVDNMHITSKPSLELTNKTWKHCFNVVLQRLAVVLSL